MESIAISPALLLVGIGFILALVVNGLRPAQPPKIIYVPVEPELDRRGGCLPIIAAIAFMFVVMVLMYPVIG